jgi:hypothetical protein
MDGKAAILPPTPAITEESGYETLNACLAD